METCPHCGRPLDQVDDFWFCDNPDCPRPRRAFVVGGPAASLSDRELEALEARARQGSPPTAAEALRLVAELRRLRADVARHREARPDPEEEAGAEAEE